MIKCFKQLSHSGLMIYFFTRISIEYITEEYYDCTAVFNESEALFEKRYK